MTLDRWLTRPRPPANLMEEVISIWHDEALTEHKFHGLARQYATRLKLSDRAVSLMIVAFKTLPSRPNAPCPRPLREHEWDELKDPLVRELGETSLSLFRGFQKVRNAGSRRSAVRAEPIKEHETVDMKLAHSFSKVRACIGLEFE